MLREMDIFEKIIKKASERKASDIHFISGLKPSIRVDGEIEELIDLSILKSMEIKEIISKYLTVKDFEELEKNRELDFSFSVENISRYRGNIHYEKSELSLVLRVLSNKIPDLLELKLPSVVDSFIEYSNGLILVTGATGSGKSTTLASLIDKINRNYSKNIITIEDPIEYIYEKKKSLIRQREVGKDTPSFERALKGVLRQDPDIILIGELRDALSIESALIAAETGHLVFATLHTNGAVESIERIISAFPAEKHEQIKSQLSLSLRAVLSQELIPSTRGGRVPITEIMIVTQAVSSLILNGKLNQISSHMETGKKLGMITIEDSLRDSFEKGIISQSVYKNKMNLLKS